MIPTIRIQRLRPDSDADIPLPRYMTAQAAGMDVCAAVREDTVVPRGQIVLLPTGFADRAAARVRSPDPAAQRSRGQVTASA